MTLQHQKHNDWYNKQLKKITELYASSSQSMAPPWSATLQSTHFVLCYSSSQLRLHVLKLNPRRPSLLLLSTHFAIGNTHEDPSLQATGLHKDLSYTQSVIAHSIEKTIIIPQYLQFGHRSDEEKKEEKRKKALYTTHRQAATHARIINLTLTLTCSWVMILPRIPSLEILEWVPWSLDTTFLDG